MEKILASIHKGFHLSDADRAAIYDHLAVASGALNQVRSVLDTTQERLDAIADILNKMVPPLR